MTRQIIVQSADGHRRQTLLPSKHAGSAPVGLSPPRKGPTRRVSEMAGKTAADCTALCCCCPCTVMNVILLAVYKVPVGLCRKASMRRRIKRSVAKKRAAAVANANAGAANGDEYNAAEDSDSVADLLRKRDDVECGDDVAADDLEKEMWARFNGTGFWRSPSTRDT